MRRDLKLSTTAGGENVVVNELDDIGLFRDSVEPTSGIHCTSPVQTCLDLYIADKFDSQGGLGPACVRKCVEESKALDERSPDQRQVDAFGQVDGGVRALGLRHWQALA